MKIPQIAIDKFREYTALNNLAKRMFLLPFTFKKVTKLVIEAEQIREQAWEEIYKLHPELRDKKLSFNHETKEITIISPIGDKVECECGCCGDKAEPAPATPAQSPKKAAAKKTATKKVKE
jgi:hypothetical protein